MVRRAGLEPATPKLEATDSVQLNINDALRFLFSSTFPNPFILILNPFGYLTVPSTPVTGALARSKGSSITRSVLTNEDLNGIEEFS